MSILKEDFNTMNSKALERTLSFVTWRVTLRRTPFSQAWPRRRVPQHVKGVILFLTICTWMTGFAGVTQAKPHTQVSLLSEKSVITTNDFFDVGILLKMDPGWHTYYKEPGDSGYATTVEWKLPEGVEAEALRWPKPVKIVESGLTVYGYTNEVMLLSRLHVQTKDVSLQTPLQVEASVGWLECAESCVPGRTTVTLPLAIAKVAINSDTQTLALFKKYQTVEAPSQPPPNAPPPVLPPSHAPSVTSSPTPRASWALGVALTAAFLGGLILNLMPCVLPVLAIKILGFVRDGGNPARTRRLGLVFALGVLVSLWVMAGVVIAIQATGSRVGWGFQFQNPSFLMLMALLVTAIALNFFGIFEVELGEGLSSSASRIATGSGFSGAFFNGVLATILATPCTAPYLGSAIGYALSQPPATILLTFTCIGIGLALPYMLLCCAPELLKFLPRPGMWMLRFKQAMGFPMLATAVWLVYNLSAHSVSGAFWFTAWLILAAFFVWIAGSILRGQLVLITLVLMGIGFFARSHVLGEIRLHPTAASGMPSTESGIAWKPFSKTALNEAMKTSHPIFVDFTADWCLTCKANKKTSLEIPAVENRFRELEVIPLLADWTRSNPEITDALYSFGRAGVPLYVIYPANRSKPPIVLPELLTPQIVLDALEATAEK